MAENYVLLETIEVSQNLSSLTFDNIPQTGYTDLKVVISARQGAENAFDLTFNGNSASYTTVKLQGNGSSASGGSGGVSSAIRVIGIAPSSATAGTYSNSEIYLSNYAVAQKKVVSYEGVNESNAVEIYSNIAAGLWSNTDAISSITITPRAGTIEQYSVFSLYGIANSNTTPSDSAQAIGGNIIANDGTYWYHAFLASGTFTPSVDLTIDSLVIAGGGGGAVDVGGGGGAGGVKYATSLSCTSGTNYTVIVGAGGNGFPQSGNNSVLSGTGITTQTAIGGGAAATGGGSSGSYTSASSGGSGGGGSHRYSYGGSATSGQGYAGGDASPSSANGAGGGGGAGAVGGSAGSAGGGSVNGGAGGAGTNAYSSWATATTTGVSGYYAGGGGGAAQFASGGASGSGGGGAGGYGNASSTCAGGNGVANTGSGGGGQGGNAPGGYNPGNGGSGIVIIRYAM